MPLTKEEYERAMKMKPGTMTPELYTKLTTLDGGPTERDPKAYDGAKILETVSKAGTKAPVDRAMPTLKLPARDGTKYPVEGGLPAVEKHAYFHPDDFNAEAGKSKSGATMLEDGGTTLDWARAEMGGPGYMPPSFPAPKAGVQLADGTGHNINTPANVDYLVQQGKMTPEEGEKLKAAVKAATPVAPPPAPAPAQPPQSLASLATLAADLKKKAKK